MSAARILICAGGSGGHIFPAIALAKTLQSFENGADIFFVGANKVLDRRIFEKEGFRFSLISANKLPYGLSIRIIPFFIKAAIDTVRSVFIVASFRPDVIVGFGGYISFPVIFVGSIFRVPSLVHEQNAVPGRSNRILFGMAKKIAISFKDTVKYIKNPNKAVFTGNPIRTEDFRNDRNFGIKRFGFDTGKFTILVIGGSQGSHAINATFINALEKMPDNIKKGIQVIHITGNNDYEKISASYERLYIDNRVYSFIDRIEEAYSASDLIITRAGASALFEIAFFGKPMILIPYPFAMSHQSENAAVFNTKKAAVVIREKDLSGDVFKENIESLLNDRNRLNDLAACAKAMSIPDASRRLAEEILKTGAY